MHTNRGSTGFSVFFLAIACCGCAGMTAAEEFDAGRVAYALNTEEGAREARARFEKALSLDDEYWPAALALARMDIAGKSFDAADERLRGIRIKCREEKYRKLGWELLYETHRAAGRLDESLRELRAYRAEYSPPQALPLNQAQPRARERDKPYLNPAEIHALSKFEEELICLLEGRPLPSEKKGKVDIESFLLPRGAPEASAQLVAETLARNIEGKPPALTKQPAPSLTDTYLGRVFISIYRPNRDRILLRGTGETLLSAVMAALAGLNVTLPSAKGLRFRVDFEISRTVGENIGDINLNFVPGLDGLAVSRGARDGFVLPGDLLESDVQSVGMLRRRLESEVGGGAAAALSWSRFRVKSYLVTGLSPESKAVPLFRGHTESIDTSVEARKKAAAAAADFLVRIQRSDGSWPYRFDAASGPLGGRRRYAMRDAEVAHFLLEAYERFGNEAYLESARRGLDRLSGEMRDAREDSVETAYLMDRAKAGRSEVERVTLGAASLASLAFTKHYAVTGNSAYLENSRKLAAFLLSMQRADGSFNMFFSPTGEDIIQKPMLYYPGAAALALLKLGTKNDDKEMVDSAVKALGYYLPEYNRAKRFDPTLVDAVLSLPGNMDPGGRLRISAYEHAMMYLELINKGEGEPDLAGAIASAPNRYPVVLPAMVASACAAVAREKGAPEATAEKCGAAVDEMIPFLLRHQLNEVSGHYLASPERAAGGVRSSLTSNLVRSSVVVHWANALLGSIDIEGSDR